MSDPSRTFGLICSDIHARRLFLQHSRQIRLKPEIGKRREYHRSVNFKLEFPFGTVSTGDHHGKFKADPFRRCCRQRDPRDLARLPQPICLRACPPRHPCMSLRRLAGPASTSAPTPAITGVAVPPRQPTLSGGRWQALRPSMRSLRALFTRMDLSAAARLVSIGR
jgi:hypothetical protein